MQKQTKTNLLTKRLTESAVMLALTVVLSYVKLVDLPYGGSITLCSMLPLTLISYRYGMYWGFLVGFVNGLIQLLMGLKNLSYATSALAAVAIILLDYIFAFTASGLGGIFRNKKNQTSGIMGGLLITCVVRYSLHVISGCTVWAGLSIPTSDAFIYSLVYNATYMLPELIILIIGGFWLSGAIDFKSQNFRRISANQNSKQGFILKLVGSAGAAAALIADIVLIAPNLQNAESGEFDITGFLNVNFKTVLIITIIGAIWLISFLILAKKKK